MNDVFNDETATAERRNEQISLDREFVAALQDPTHVGHKAANAHRQALYEEAYTGKATGAADRTPSSSTRVASDDQSADPGNAFFAAPTDAKDYRFDPTPQGLSHDIELEQMARRWFHQAAIPQWLARNIVREWNRTVERKIDPRQAADAAAATEQALRRKWGHQYEAHVAAARSLVRSLENDEVIELLDRSGLANSEYLIRQLAALSGSRQAER